MGRGEVLVKIGTTKKENLHGKMHVFVGTGKNRHYQKGKFTWKNAYFCAVMFKIYMKAQKHASFHVYFHLVPPFTPINFIIMVKGLLTEFVLFGTVT